MLLLDLLSRRQIEIVNDVGDVRDAIRIGGLSYLLVLTFLLSLSKILLRIFRLALKTILSRICVCLYLCLRIVALFHFILRASFLALVMLHNLLDVFGR